MHTGFWGLMALSAILLGYSGYIWKKETQGKKLSFAAKRQDDSHGDAALS